MIQYNQTKFNWWSNWCNVLSTLTALSNTHNRTLSDIEINQVFNEIWRWALNGWLSSKEIPKVVESWNRRFEKSWLIKIKTNTVDFMKYINAWNMLIIWIRFNADFFNDSQDNWVIDRIQPTGKKLWWHSLCIQLINWKITFVNAYYLYHKYNTFSVDIWVLYGLIQNKLIQEDAYAIKKISKRMLSVR